MENKLHYTESILYRYFFYDWMFKDMRCARGVIERSAFWRHNQSMRTHLWIYLYRWCVISALAFAVGAIFGGNALELPVIAGIGFTGASFALCVMAIIGASLAMLARPERRPD